MMAPNTEQTASHNPSLSGLQPPTTVEPTAPPFTLTRNTSDNAASTHSLLLRNPFILHHRKAGVNPLVDAAAYLFSLIGQLKALKSYHTFSALQAELITEINTFQDTAKVRGYSSEYLLVSRYAICATLDDIISHTPWGSHGQWDNYSLLHFFNPDSTKQERFFLILERIIKDPALYIDVMEFMYICLSLGYKGSYRSNECHHHQLEKITHALYQRIRAYHGDFSKALSPFSPKPPPAAKLAPPNTSIGFSFLVTSCIIMILFISFGYLLDTISNQAYQALMQIGKSTPYETHPSEHV